MAVTTVRDADIPCTSHKLLPTSLVGSPTFSPNLGTLPATAPSSIIHHPTHSLLPPSPSLVINGGMPSLWVGDLDPYITAAHLANSLLYSGHLHLVNNIKLIFDKKNTTHKQWPQHMGYGFLDVVNDFAGEYILRTLDATPILGTGRNWRLDFGKNCEGIRMLRLLVTQNRCAHPTESGDRRYKEDSGQMATTCVYVGNLNRNFTDMELLSVFRPLFKSVKQAKVIRNELGASLGYGFVRFTDQMEAADAVENLQGYIGMKLSMANKPRVGSQSRSGRISGIESSCRPEDRGNTRGGDLSVTTIFLGGISQEATEEYLYNTLHTLSPGDVIEGVCIPAVGAEFAFVRYKHRASADKVVRKYHLTEISELNSTKPVRVEIADHQLILSEKCFPLSKAAGVQSPLGVDEYSNERRYRARRELYSQDMKVVSMSPVSSGGLFIHQKSTGELSNVDYAVFSAPNGLIEPALLAPSFSASPSVTPTVHSPSTTPDGSKRFVHDFSDDLSTRMSRMSVKSERKVVSDGGATLSSIQRLDHMTEEGVESSDEDIMPMLDFLEDDV